MCKEYCQCKSITVNLLVREAPKRYENPDSFDQLTDNYTNPKGKRLMTKMSTKITCE